MWMPPLETISVSKIPPFDITMESWPFSTRAFEKSLVPLSTPPIFNSGKICITFSLFMP